MKSNFNFKIKNLNLKNKLRSNTKTNFNFQIIKGRKIQDYFEIKKVEIQPIKINNMVILK